MWWVWYSCSIWSRWRWFQISVRSSSSRRQPTDPPFHDRVRPWGSNGTSQDLDPAGGEHRIPGRSELRIPIAQQELHAVRVSVEVDQQVPGLLGHPAVVRVRGHAKDPDPSGGVLDDRQDVGRGAVEQVHVEEVDGQDRCGLAVTELRPRWPGASGRGRDAGPMQDFSDGGRRPRQTQAGELSVNAPVALGGVRSSTLPGGSRHIPAARSNNGPGQND